MIDRMVRRLRPAWTRRAVDVLAAKYERFAPPEWIALPKGTQLVVIAPHPDDESIGVGGLIALWQASQRQTDVIFLTDGAAGAPEMRHEDLCEADRARIMDQTAQTRRTETDVALKTLGATGCWLDGRDGRLSEDLARLTDQLASRLQSAAPDLIAAPFPMDRHPDHAAAARVLGPAGAGLPSQTPVLAYEVWSPLPATALLDITAVAAKKWQAIAAHQSQMRSTDYLGASQSLGTYRAITGGRDGRVAEAYYRTTLSDYASLAAAMQV